MRKAHKKTLCALAGETLESELAIYPADEVKAALEEMQVDEQELSSSEDDDDEPSSLSGLTSDEDEFGFEPQVSLSRRKGGSSSTKDARASSAGGSTHPSGGKPMASPLPRSCGNPMASPLPRSRGKPMA